MELIRERALQLMEELERLSEHDYKLFELALVLFLRSDRFTLKNYITDSELEELDKIIGDSESIMSDDLKEAVDEILEDEEEE